uniref:Organic solute carrier partner 1 n=1 Tax=Salmo trutta TaxID=8032 RepID=A0A674DTZ4_SALTR
MSSRTLPLLFINLGGEMLYILDQRLRAQNIPADKAKKVMNDIITTMFNKKFLEELFKPQELYSKKALRTVFDRLAHASIMRLNQASMDKVWMESCHLRSQPGTINLPSIAQTSAKCSV